MNCDDQVQREAMLRRSVLAGDEAAWRAWCLESFDELQKYVLWRCGGRHDWSDDIVQETWLTAVRRVRRFDPVKGSFLAWLRGIAANSLRNYLRRERRFAGQPFSENGKLLIDHQHQPQLESKSNRESEDRSRKIAFVLAALSDRHESVLRAKYLEGLSVEQIAALWNETPKAIESLLTRARQSFREQYVTLTNDSE